MLLKKEIGKFPILVTVTIFFLYFKGIIVVIKLYTYFFEWGEKN